jgi:hypothetical protein
MKDLARAAERLSALWFLPVDRHSVPGQILVGLPRTEEEQEKSKQKSDREYRTHEMSGISESPFWALTVNYTRQTLSLDLSSHAVGHG